jgi:hypothetical protein
VSGRRLQRDLCLSKASEYKVSKYKFIFLNYNSRMKPDDVKIVQIAVASGEGLVYGLGEDSNVYVWTSEGEWKLHVQ